jgi:L-amino acid N-acyltransferase YncA
MSLQIRAATEADLQSILDLYVEIEDDSQVLPIEKAGSIFERMQSYPRYKTYVIVLGGSTVETFALLIMDNLAHMGAPSGIVEDVMMRQDWRRKGVGNEMMRFTMNGCRERCCYKWTLSSRIKREATHRFHDDLGFRWQGYSLVMQLGLVEGHGEPNVT